MRASKLINKHKRIDRFYSGLVTEVCGPAGSGKSYLCYQEMISYLHSSPGQAIIIDTTGSLDAAELADLVQARDGSLAMLDRIQITRSFDIYGVVEAIQEIQHLLLDVQREEGKDRSNAIGIVIIDYITNPMSLMMQRGQTPGHDLMVCLARDLTQLSRKDVCVLVINSTVKTTRDAKISTTTPGALTKNREVAFDGVTMKPALGSTWPYLVDYSLHIYPVPDGTVRKPGKRGFIQEVVHSRIGGYGEWEMV